MENLNELITLADKGDLKAIIDIAQYYVDNNKMVDALDWWKRAYHLGHISSITVICHIQKLCAIAVIDMAGLKSAEDELKELYQWTKLQQKHLKNGEISIKEDSSVLEFASYKLATIYYSQNNYKQVFSLSDDLNLSLRSQLLLGNTYFKNELYSAAYNLLAKLENNSTYAQKIKEIKDRDDYEIFSYCVATHYLAGIYRIGLPSIHISSDLNKSHSILSFALPYVSDSAYSEVITEELAKFQKKLFGGYKYIG
ncbi:MAG: hypothetical protein IKJ27_07115 [Clostridia bacterium]|nr:hypothetical protein [Clostridia bacterium]